MSLCGQSAFTGFVLEARYLPEQQCCVELQSVCEQLFESHWRVREAGSYFLCALHKEAIIIV